METESITQLASDFERRGRSEGECDDESYISQLDTHGLETRNVGKEHKLESRVQDSNSRMMPHTSHSTETDTPFRTTPKPTKEQIKENLLQHRQAIKSSLSPSELYSLCEQLDIEECATNDFGKRKEATEIVLKEVQRQNSYSVFFDSLEKTMERANKAKHMGHEYIISLLRGEEFGEKEERERSAMIVEKMRSSNIEELLNVDVIRPILFQNSLLTYDEEEALQMDMTSGEKVRKLRTILKTKGPTAHYIFAHVCLADEESVIYRSHSELLLNLTGEDSQLITRENRKRKASDYEESPATKRLPCFLESPEGLKTKKYLSEVTMMRKYHLTGQQYWQKAEDIYSDVMSSPKDPMEIKIAIILESCTMYITNRQTEVVEERVKMAKLFCLQLYRANMGNVGILQARCHWTLAKLYRYTKEYDKAKKEITDAMTESYLYGEGEERALINYCHACILLASENKTVQDEVRAIDALNIAIGCASSGEYGLDTAHCKLRLAQAYVGSSTSNTGKRRGEVPKAHIADAKRVLGEIGEDISPRTKCMALYTRSDVHRVAGEIEQAAECAKRSLEIAQQQKFKTEIASVKLRQERLQEESCLPHEQTSH